MNIAKAKEQLKNAVRAYLSRDEMGNLKISVKAQRPVFLMGPPGIGKTDIVKQVAEELNIGLVSYSITHHTRQSALGLPTIVEKEYRGQKYTVSEYTMSEIIASVYDMIEETGSENGILFLDEINCTSETLTPVMLQFLQFKTFGKHAVPDGWVVVTAGNPNEYNRSARDFDIVTWDRLKRIDIEPDYQAWRNYASSAGVHGAVLSYLDIRKENFYSIETTPDGVLFATARGWSDLSDMVKLYEDENIQVDKDLVDQYIQYSDIAEDFFAYYELYNKYRSDYKIEEVLSGKAPSDVKLRASEAAFDERLSLMGLLISAINDDFTRVIGKEDILLELLSCLKEIKQGSTAQEQLEKEQQKAERDRKRGVATKQSIYKMSSVISMLKSYEAYADFSEIKAAYDKEVAALKTDSSSVSARLKNLFGFVKDVFGSGKELLILVTELTANIFSARFISRYGSEEYYSCSDELAFYERHLALIEEINENEIL